MIWWLGGIVKQMGGYYTCKQVGGWVSQASGCK